MCRSGSLPVPARTWVLLTLLTQHMLAIDSTEAGYQLNRRLPAAAAAVQTLEFTWNDEKAGGYDRPSRRAFEQLLRLLLRLPEPPALVLLHHYAWGAAGKLFYYPPEQQLSTFAHVRWSWVVAGVASAGLGGECSGSQTVDVRPPLLRCNPASASHCPFPSPPTLPTPVL